MTIEFPPTRNYPRSNKSQQVSKSILQATNPYLKQGIPLDNKNYEER